MGVPVRRYSELYTVGVLRLPGSRQTNEQTYSGLRDGKSGVRFNSSFSVLAGTTMQPLTRGRYRQ